MLELELFCVVIRLVYFVFEYCRSKCLVGVLVFFGFFGGKSCISFYS